MVPPRPHRTAAVTEAVADHDDSDATPVRDSAPDADRGGAARHDDLDAARPPAARGLALAAVFAEALSRKLEPSEGLVEAFERAIEARLLTAGAAFESVGRGPLVLRAATGVTGGTAAATDLLGQAPLLREVVDSGQEVALSAEAVPRDAAVAVLRATGATTALLLPLTAGGRRLGALLLAARDIDLHAEPVRAGARVAAAQVARVMADDQALRQVQSTAQRHRTAVRHAQDAILILDAGGAILEANAQAESLFDRSEVELLGRHLSELVDAEDRLLLNALQRQLVAQGRLSVHRVRVRRVDGRPIDVDATAARVPSNGDFVSVVVLRDMTNRRGAREGLAAGEERFRALVTSTGDTILTLDGKGRVTGLFGRCPAESGLRAGKCIGRHLGAALGERDAEVHDQAVRRALAGETVTYDWSPANGDSPRYLETTLAPVGSRADEVRGLVGVVRDVTERRALQGRLLVADRMASLGLLAASVAQDLSAPVASVLTNLSHATTIMSEVQERATAGELKVALAAAMGLAEPVRDARAAGVQLHRTVQDLRTLTRATDERIGPVDLRRALEAALRMAAPELKGRARLVRDFGQAPPAQGDEARLVQVFINLLVNAGQACSGAAAPRPEIRVRTATDEGGSPVVEVIDTGRGMPPEELGRIFEPFFTTKPAGVGTGLGLTIAQRVVGALGGRLAITSEVGQGTTVRVVLRPAAAAAAATTNPATTAPAS
jgi:PAS domain S-box-containing protein